MRWRLFLKPGRGLDAERYALRYLKRRGLRLQARNYACFFGEIDLIMREKDCLVFIEVRFRNNGVCGLAEETVSHQKQKKIIATAKHYLQYLQRCDRNDKLHCRFDVMALSGNDTAKWKVEWIKNAFVSW